MNCGGDDLTKESVHGIILQWVEIFSQLPWPYCSLRKGTYKISWNPRMRSRAGLCKPLENAIELNPHLLTSKEVFSSVLVHELCHLAVFRGWPRAPSHGSKWQGLMVHLGFTAKACHNLPVINRRSQKRWDLQCECKTHKVSTVIFNRIKKGVKYKCLSCKKQLREDITQTSESQLQI